MTNAPTQSVEPVTPTRRHRFWAASAGLIAMVLLAHGTILHNDFITFDDQKYVYSNPQVIKGLTAETFLWAFTSFNVGNWHPVTMLSHLLDVTLFGLDPAGHHGTALVLHGLNAVLLFVVLTRLTGHAWRSWFVAALFAVHPAHVESVAWVSSRKDLLSVFFLCLALHMHLLRLQDGWRPGRWLCAVFFALALMSKPTAVTFPVLLLLLDFWPMNRFRPERGAAPAQGPVAPGQLTGVEAEGDWRLPLRRLPGLVMEKWELIGLSAVACIITLLSQADSQAMSSVQVLSIADRLFNALHAYVQYLRILVWPVDLAVLYPLRPITPLAAAGSLLILVVLSWAVLLLGRRPGRRYAITGWSWFIVALLPMIGLIHVGVQSMADRYCYIPFIGLYIVVVWLLADLVATAPRLRPAVLAVAFAVLCTLGVMTHRQSVLWASPVTLFSHGIRSTGQNAPLEDYLGRTYALLGQYELAAGHFRNSLAIDPHQPQTLENLGFAYMVLDRPHDAAEAYRIADAMVPLSGPSRQNLAWAYLLSDRPGLARDTFLALEREGDSSAQVLTGIAASQGALGNTDEALSLLRQVKTTWPEFTNADYQAALILVNSGQARGAVQTLERLVASEPENLAAGRLLARAYLQLGMHARARETLANVLRKNPADAKARDALRQIDGPAGGPADSPPINSGKGMP
jgi:tetratricopeptide (TPR) repeat protein